MREKYLKQAATRVSDSARRDAQQQRIAEQMQDPLIQQKAAEIEIKKADVQRKAIADTARINLNAQRQAEQIEIEKERLATQRELAGAELGQKIASDLLEAERESEKQAREDYEKGIATPPPPLQPRQHFPARAGTCLPCNAPLPTATNGRAPPLPPPLNRNAGLVADHEGD